LGGEPDKDDVEHLIGNIIVNTVGEGNKGNKQEGLNAQMDEEAAKKSYEEVQKYYEDAKDLRKRKETKERNGWDLKFQNYWGQLLKAQEAQNFLDTVTTSEKFLEHVGKFRKEVHELVKEIVDEMHLDKEHRKYHPKKYVQNNHVVFLDSSKPLKEVSEEVDYDTLFYFENNICIKLTYNKDYFLEEPLGEQDHDYNHPSNSNLNRRKSFLEHELTPHE